MPENPAALTRAPMDWTARLLYGVAIALGVGCVAVTIWSWRLARRSEAELGRAAAVQAEVLARDFAEEVRFSTTEAANRIFGPIAFETRPWDTLTLRRLDAAIDSAVACECVRILARTGGLYAWSSAEPERLVSIALDSSRVTAIAAAIARVAETFEIDGTRPVVLKSDGEGREIVGSTLIQRRDGLLRAIGYLGDPRGLSEAVFAPATKVVERARFGDSTSGVASWTVIGPGGDTVLQRGTHDRTSVGLSAAFFRQRFAAEQGPPPADETGNAARSPYWVHVAVSPAALGRHLYGGFPVAPSTALVPLLGSLVLAGAAVLLARRFVAQIREREAFASAVAHDLRTPLTQILLYGESLQLDRPAVQARQEAARIIVREARRLIHLVEQALQFTGRAGARPVLHLEPLDLDAAIRDTMRAFAPMLDAAGMSATLRLDVTTPVMADREVLAQVLTNVIENAIRFGPAGQTLTVSSQAHPGVAEVTVDDEGPGIPVEHLARVFEPFVRRPGSPGTGIGLALSRQSLEVMDGTLSATAAPGGGARLCIRLPLASSVPHQQQVGDGR